MGRMGPPNVDYGRVGKSPAGLLTGEPHAHWLELLGYTPVRAELKTPHGKEGFAQTRSNAGPIRVRAEIPSVTRKRAFLNQAEKSSIGMNRLEVSLESRLSAQLATSAVPAELISLYIVKTERELHQNPLNSFADRARRLARFRESRIRRLLPLEV